MFESLTSRLNQALRTMRGQARITEKNIQEALREIRLALLEADVHVGAVKEFVSRVCEKALGVEVLKTLSPGQQVIKIVNDELIRLLGGDQPTEVMPTGGLTVVMMCGLQGSGKTTASAKLALRMKADGRRPMMVAADIYRPAAIDQLQVLGERVNIPVFSQPEGTKPEQIVERALVHAKAEGHDFVILDTAGRLHIDEEMMQELVRLRKIAQPQRILLVIDSMVGQDAVLQAEHFHGKLDVSGVILSKLDGDARGGVALSVRHAVGRPILYASTGEKPEDFETFHPDRMASRILGMGDVLTLIEKAQESIDQDEAMAMQQKLMDRTFTLQDWLGQLRNMQKMGGVTALMKLIPGMGGMDIPEDKMPGEKDTKCMEAIIQSMTSLERTETRVIGSSRRKRIARGSGTTVAAVNNLLKQFAEMKRMMKSMTAPMQEKVIRHTRAKNKKGKKGKNKKYTAPKVSKKMRKMQQMGQQFPGMDLMGGMNNMEDSQGGGESDAALMEKIKSMMNKDK
jgi:signal recognition particle subunit SRP54